MLYVTIGQVNAPDIGPGLSNPVHYQSFQLATSANIDVAHRADPDDVKQALRGTNINAVIVYGNVARTPALKRTLQMILQHEQPGRFPVIGWGVGGLFIGHETIDTWMLRILRATDFISYREQGLAPWVPCPSCMHSMFDDFRNTGPEHRVVFYENPASPFLGLHDSYPRMTSRNLRFQQVLAFLSSGRTVVTSDYYGAYWAALLGRRVIVSADDTIPFRGFPWHLVYINDWSQWDAAELHTTENISALEESRMANQEYAAYVRGAIFTPPLS